MTFSTISDADRRVVIVCDILSENENKNYDKSPRIINQKSLSAALRMQKRLVNVFTLQSLRCQTGAFGN